ncbi:MAG: polyprenol phosphomannose-dependent alpha 1,6 mannosyltransferase MptB [Salegentibacter sp.]|uniref:polyprenol phosphomannose-dependent alpha 1,6 mannosyltransferase MptB n=1 Tax=Salegentibacter sp. TaxID=1903072 RepID=UPI0028703BAF|nr:polyprenol phosphomannose-dependent alpha 1,6 mannosyltransferase MptB [Salegentibacter sp.]MDR9456377.1 polyprenol phosphomannose-dependent alpha 1,6 mannosyltransferase MptB [Salegentibacter sp.]
MKEFFKNHRFSLLIAITGIAFYFSFAFNLERNDFIKLIGLYGGLFFISFRLIQLEKTNFWFLAGLALLYRLIFLLALPNLTQDFYRFIWDGNLILEGINPYLFKPSELIGNFQGIWTELYKGMGSLSQSNFTSYPPVNQLIFAVSALLGGKSILGSVIIMRILIILADLGTLFFGRKLLQDFGLPQHQIFWFILNPFIIIELTGNMHFEGVMLFFIIFSLYLLHKGKWLMSAILLGISVSVKLIPLMFLPLLWNYFRKNQQLKIQKLWFYYATVAITVLLTFLPFLSSELISNFSASIGLWFQKFEFNASIYYLIRWIGFELKGYNIIAAAGKILPVLTLLIILGLAFFRRNRSTTTLITSMLFGITAYLFLSTTVHPWYLATPLLLSVFTKYRFMILWIGLVFMSYFAYSNPGFEENSWLLAVEYLPVFGYLIYEIFKNEFQTKKPVI